MITRALGPSLADYLRISVGTKKKISAAYPLLKKPDRFAWAKL